MSMPKIIRKIGKSIVLALPRGAAIADTFRHSRSLYSRWIRRRRLQKYGLEIMEKIHKIFEAYPDVVYFADFGTLLGLVREGWFIKHDEDIDFSIVEGSISPKALVSVMLGAGFSFLRGFCYNDKITELAFAYKNVGIDFFYAYNYNDGQYMQYYEALGWSEEEKSDIAFYAGRLCRPKLMGVESINIHGVDISAPVNREELLTATYGANWRTPNPSWQSKDAGDTKREKLDGIARIFYDPL